MLRWIIWTWLGWNIQVGKLNMSWRFQVQPTDESSITTAVPYLHVLSLPLWPRSECDLNLMPLERFCSVCWTSVMLGWALCRQHSRDLYLVHWWNNPVKYRVSVDWPFGRGRWPVIYNCTYHSDGKHYKHLFLFLFSREAIWNTSESNKCSIMKNMAQGNCKS